MLAQRNCLIGDSNNGNYAGCQRVTIVSQTSLPDPNAWLLLEHSSMVAIRGKADGLTRGAWDVPLVSTQCPVTGDAVHSGHMVWPMLQVKISAYTGKDGVYRVDTMGDQGFFINLHCG